MVLKSFFLVWINVPKINIMHAEHYDVSSNRSPAHAQSYTGLFNGYALAMQWSTFFEIKHYTSPNKRKYCIFQVIIKSYEIRLVTCEIRLLLIYMQQCVCVCGYGLQHKSCGFRWLSSSRCIVVNIIRCLRWDQLALKWLRPNIFSASEG